MDNKNKKDNNQDLPGYPHYPSNEDITRAGNNNGNEDLNEEQLAAADDTQELRPKIENSLENNTAFVNNETPNTTDNNANDADVDIVMGTEADVTEEDLQMLENADQNMDTKDDQYMIEGGL
ncbi:MAG: hypothetical protein JSS96_12445, partial [Bacteroidetes bacterium]|nr:hypothetical protein [Bacteroidota bacterium]